MSGYTPFFLDERHNLAVALIPRCGSQAIREWLGKDAIAVKNDDRRLYDMSRRVAFIRNPIERLASAYSLFYWLHDYEIKSKKPKDRGIPIKSWDVFVDHILDPSIPDDLHWMSQIKIVGSVPNIYHRFENIIEHFEKYRPGIFPHNNWTSRRPVSEYKRKEINKKYASDFELWGEII